MFFLKIRFKSKKAIVPQIITPADNNAVINQFSPQLATTLYKQPNATAIEAYFARHFSSLETFLLLKIHPTPLGERNKRSCLFQKCTPFSSRIGLKTIRLNLIHNDKIGNPFCIHFFHIVFEQNNYLMLFLN